MFIDYAEIRVKAGSGGRGCVSFRKEKFVPRGGPDGGNGGRGGDIIIKADRSLSTLLDFKYKSEFRAENGKHGSGKNKKGKDGSVLVLNVPLGTVVRKTNSEKVSADLVKDGQEYTAARGGSGGRGNASMKSPVNRAPREFENGGPGEESELVLELKIISDAGIIGAPNAGKSSLLASMSNAKPKVAGYPFTTLNPQIGTVRYDGFRVFTAAEIPGLIKGAHEGRGLGDRFLRHIERTKLLVHLVDLSEDPVKNFLEVKRELDSYSGSIKPGAHIVAGSKLDLPGARENLEKLRTEIKKHGGVHETLFGVSSLTGEGVEELKEFLGGMVRKMAEDES